MTSLLILAHLLPTPLWELLHWPVNSDPNGGYGFWSGIAGSFLVGGGIATYWHKHNCHEHRCLRLSWHPDSDGHPICRVHHKDHPSKGWFRADRSHPRHASEKKRQRGAQAKRDRERPTPARPSTL